ncbi:type IV secretion system immunity protein Tsi7 [Bowmanella denitrificans]|uniref:Type IV secretion system immunity protein Tsi7 n=1 Tax=Bowmanella denitrificans TaxID=366582 RepID=A0ABP3H4Z1_9ALTE
MSDNFLDSRYLVQGAARYADLVYLISKARGLADDDVPHSSIIAMDRDKWADAFNTNWNATAIAISKKPSEKMVLIGEDGQVCSYVGGVRTDEKSLANAPMIRSASSIGGYVYACGMKRQVFKRVDENRWTDLSAPMPGKSERAGFEAISGYSEKEIYAVGWNGEIWKFDGSQWVNFDGLTNLILTSVCCADDGQVYVAGQQGTLLIGRNEQWQQVEFEDGENEDFWGLSYFQGRLYLSTMTNLYTLQDQRLIPVDLGDLNCSTFFALTHAEQVLWSVGSHDLLAYDGKQWRAYK